MRLILKEPMPSSFQNYIRELNASFEEMDKDVKTDLRTALVLEQNGICAYCQQILRKGEIKIEHHCEQSICNGQDGTIDKRLDYSNLFAVCMGQGGREKEQHCDTKKANFNINNGLPMSILPTNSGHINTISYSRTGLIKSSNSVYNIELNKLLNLNAKYIRALRKKKWLQVFSNSKQKAGGINKLKMARLIDRDLDLKNSKFTTPFPAMLESMKSKFC